MVLKYCGSVIGATYGLYATLTDFHEQKSGKKVLSKKGRIGILILVLSSLLTLITTGISDYKEQKDKEVTVKAEAAKRAETLEKEEKIINSLKEQLEISDKLSKNTTQLSEKLSETSTSIENTAALSHSVLKETVDRINHLEITVRFWLHPKFLIENESLELSEDFIALCKKESLFEFGPLDSARALVKKYSPRLANAILDSFSFYTILSKATAPIYSTSIPFEDNTHFFQYSSRKADIINFDLILPYDAPTTFEDHWVLYFTVSYRIPFQSNSGITKNTDFNGKWWYIHLVLDRPSILQKNQMTLENTIEYDDVTLFIGGQSGNAKAISLKYQLPESKIGLWEMEFPLISGRLFGKESSASAQGIARVPNDFFKSLLGKPALSTNKYKK